MDDNRLAKSRSVNWSNKSWFFSFLMLLNWRLYILGLRNLLLLDNQLRFPSCLKASLWNKNALDFGSPYSFCVNWYGACLFSFLTIQTPSSSRRCLSIVALPSPVSLTISLTFRPFDSLLSILPIMLFLFSETFDLVFLDNVSFWTY